MQNQNLTIKVNGEPFVCEIGFSLFDLINHLNFSAKSIVLEHNADIIPDAQLKKTFLNDGDNVEIVTIVGGG